MPWIEVIPEKDATGDLADLYRERREKGQWSDVPPGEAVFSTPYSVFTPNGASLKRLMAWSDAVRFGRSDLSRLQREMIAAVTSQLNHCVF